MSVISTREQLICQEFPQVFEKFCRAVNDYRLIEEHDKILVAASGGKDSLSAMHLLDYYRATGTVSFDMLVCNVDLGYGCANRRLLAEHFECFGIDYVFVERNILEGKERGEIDCFWCSWNRRKTLFETARTYGCNRLSLGHHLDDIIHTALMNFIYYAEVSTSSPRVDLFDGQLSLIRPLCYIAEEETSLFAEALKMPLSCCACPQKKTSRRAVIKNTFLPLFDDFPAVRGNIFNALRKQKKTLMQRNRKEEVPCHKN